MKHSLKSCADTRICLAQETVWIRICNLLKYPAYSLVGTLDLPRYVHDFHTGYADQMSRIVVHQGSQAFVKSTRYSNSGFSRKSSNGAQSTLQLLTESKVASKQPSDAQKDYCFLAGPPMGRPYRPKNAPKSGSRMKQKRSSLLYAY